MASLLAENPLPARLAFMKGDQLNSENHQGFTGKCNPCKTDCTSSMDYSFVRPVVQLVHPLDEHQARTGNQTEEMDWREREERDILLWLVVQIGTTNYQFTSC